MLPAVRHRFAPQQPPAWRRWTHAYDDPASGRVELSGALSTPPEGTDHLLVLVHGLGGSIESHYMAPAARAATDLGLACLRLNLRGADGRPFDLYHAGLTLDLHETLRSPDLEGFSRIDFMGFSLGGHVTLKFGTEVGDPRVGAVAAVCSPLDLGATVRDFDALPRYPYREYIVGGVKRNVLRILGQRDDLPGGLEPEAVRRVTTLRDFDAATVVRRFGFRDTDDYYRSQSVMHRLRSFRTPALLVAAEDDPMISARSLRAALAGGSGDLEVAWSRRGGHVAFPPGVDLRPRLGLSGPAADRDVSDRDAVAEDRMEHQVIAWLRSR